MQQVKLRFETLQKQMGSFCIRGTQLDIAPNDMKTEAENLNGTPALVN